MERVDEVVEHFHVTCRRSGTSLEGDDMVDHDIRSSRFPHHSAGDRAPAAPLGLCWLFHPHMSLPAAAPAGASSHGPTLSAPVDLLCSHSPLMFSRALVLLGQLADGVRDGPWFNCIHPPALETRASTDRADPGNSSVNRDCQWLLVTAVTSEFQADSAQDHSSRPVGERRHLSLLPDRLCRR